jgi:hypothetical protein
VRPSAFAVLRFVVSDDTDQLADPQFLARRTAETRPSPGFISYAVEVIYKS